MKLKEIGEFGFIRRVSRGCLVRPDNVMRAIGDDAAAFFTKRDHVTLLTTDLLLEGVHFVREATSAFNLGYKALAVNLSDIAAMGGTAWEAFVSIAVPDDCSVEFLDEVYDGMKHLAAEFNVNLLGGDTTGSRRDLVINIAVVGSVAEQEMLRRDTARPGDIICCTGSLGDSRAGLHLILEGIARDRKWLQQLFEAHVLPRPHLEEGRFLARLPGVHAAIDVSDGLSSDIGHIAEESGLGVRLEADCLPISDALQSFCGRFGFDPVDYALAGGEDYTLLCTVSSERVAHVAASFTERFERPLHRLGRMTTPREMLLLQPDGASRDFRPSGWNHFQQD